jgi:hypothetical protein
MGVNLGHRAIGSNAWQFMRRMGVNAARLFLYTTIPCACPPQCLMLKPRSRAPRSHRASEAVFRDLYVQVFLESGLGLQPYLPNQAHLFIANNGGAVRVSVPCPGLSSRLSPVFILSERVRCLQGVA